jgi:hypothetical protein
MLGGSRHHGASSGCRWTVATNISHKQPRTNDKRWSSSVRVRRGANKPYRKKTSLLRNVIKSLGPGGIIWINDLSDEIRT